MGKLKNNTKAGGIVSPNKKAVQRFLKNKPAVFGLLFILFAFVVAIGGYQLSPDFTPDTDDQITEIAREKPGFKVKVLKKHKNKIFEKSNFFKTMFNGRQNKFQLIPIVDYQFNNDSINVSVYQGKNAQTKAESYALADVIAPLSYEKKEMRISGGELQFENIEGKEENYNIAELQNRIERKQIKTRRFIFGTDSFGRDILSRLILGVRISLSVGFIAVLISLTIGVLLGALAGYFKGRVDDFIMLIINTMWSIPTLLLVFALVIALGRGFWQIFLAVGLTMWVDVARIVRGQIMAVREIQYVEAAQSLGFGHRRIIARHILPNILGPVMVIAAANFALAILIEAGLSYLGFGIQPPTPSWGKMLSENYGMLITGNPFPALVPGIAIMFMVLAFNLVGNGFRDALDVKTKMGD